MRKNEREKYIFSKKCLLIILYLFYINNIKYSDITFRSFGFSFDPTCNFKCIIKSKKNNIHKYVVHIYDSLKNIDYESIDMMGNINIFKVKNAKNNDFIKAKNGINIYFDESSFVTNGYIEGNEFVFNLLIDNSVIFKDELLYNLNRDSLIKKYNEFPFILWILKFYHHKIKTTLVFGAGVNIDYGGYDWKSLISNLNNRYYENNISLMNEISHYVGNELFVKGKVLKTSGFDVYKELNKEIYLYKEIRSFDDCSSTLYDCVSFIIKNPNIDVITYNYDTNLEYLCKKRGVRYNTVYDDNSFISKEAIVSIFHVHGLLPFEKYNESKFTDSLIFNESEYFYLYNNPYSWNISKQLHDFTFNNCIFIGISMTDPNMKRLLELSRNYLKFNFIFLKREKGMDSKTYRDVTNYLFTYDLITIWIDDYKEIGAYLENV